MKQKKKGRLSYGDNLYELKGSYWLIFMHHGKLYRERIGKVKDLPLTMARNIAIKRKAEIIEGTFLPKREENITLRELSQEYLKWYLAHHHNTKESTKTKQKHLIDKLLILDKLLLSAKPFVIIYKNERSLCHLISSIGNRF